MSFLYYLRHVLQWTVPRAWCRRRLPHLLHAEGAENRATREDRVAYYNRIDAPFTLDPDAAPFRLTLVRGRSHYFMDLYEVLRYFDPAFRIRYAFGDITEVPAVPTVVKSRPIEGDHRNAILLKLNKRRHFPWVEDRTPFAQKVGKAVWRGRARQANRQAFLARYHAHPLCDVGHYHERHQDVPWVKPRLSIREQLAYKFVLSLEGNDVASNLKWILASNSVCFMPRPRYETWLMEGRLVPGRHYVLLRDDGADLEEKIDYYSVHTDEAEAIVREAQAWMAPFRDDRAETQTALWVLCRYFHDSGQWPDAPRLASC